MTSAVGSHLVYLFILGQIRFLQQNRQLISLEQVMQMQTLVTF